MPRSQDKTGRYGAREAPKAERRRMRRKAECRSTRPRKQPSFHKSDADAARPGVNANDRADPFDADFNIGVDLAQAQSDLLRRSARSREQKNLAAN